MFFRRGLGDAPDPWLDVKLWIFSIAALLALLGMTLENDWLIGGAGLLLAAGLLLRFLPSDRKQRTEEHGHPPDDAPPEEPESR